MSRRHRFWGSESDYGALLLYLGVLLSGLAGCDNGRLISGESGPQDLHKTALQLQIAEIQGGQRDEAVLSCQDSKSQLNQLIAVAGKIRSLTIDCAELDFSLLAELLAAADSLEKLKIETVVTDHELTIISDCVSLKVLNLPNGEFSNSGLEELSTLPRLELLRFRSVNVTDAGLKSIARLPSLRFLHLINVPMTDLGLELIAGMEKLESFYLDGGNCTDEGLSALIKKRFDLHFHWNDLHLTDDPNTHVH